MSFIAGYLLGLGDSSSAPVIESLTVTANGTYTAPEGVDGYSPVNVNVPNGDLVDYIKSQPSFATYDYGNGWTADIMIIDDISHLELVIPGINFSGNQIYSYTAGIHNSVRINYNGKFMWANLKNQFWTTHRWNLTNGELSSRADFTFTNVNITSATKDIIRYTADYNEVETYFDGRDPYIDTGTANNGEAYTGQFNSMCKVITALSIDRLAEAYSAFLSS